MNDTGGTDPSAGTNSSAPSGGGGGSGSYSGGLLFPPYVRLLYILLCVLILGVGILGNLMVPLVIVRTKDMRNSTNIFLMNLSIADLMVLLVCTPTVLVEVNSEPLIWVLGEEMCKAVPFVELTVAHASVLTILAISFERYYAICEPLRAGYVCTKARAMLICLFAWLFAALFTSPVLIVAEYREEKYIDGTNVTTCLMDANEFWPAFYFTATITVFFCLPLCILIGLYSVIARHLMSNPGLVAPSSHSSALKYRRQVVLMLGTVVLSFFICLLPFKAFTLYVIFASPEFILSMGVQTFYNILYVCRIMLYLNSAINPILYNLMSSKFRDGFRRLLGISARDKNFMRKGTVTTTTLTSSTRTNNSSESGGGLLRKSVVRVISLEESTKLDNGLATTIKLLNSGVIVRSDESYV